MKNIFCGMLIALMLLTALLVGVVAVAESGGTEAPALPPAEATQPEQPSDEDTAADNTATDDTAMDNTALQEAFDAYRAAQQSGRQAALEDELKGYVESGKLTQEQADLILKYYADQQALRDGTCPNCGYQFESGTGRGGRMNGGKGGRRNGGCGMNGMNGNSGMNGMNGGKGGRMKGGRGMFNQQPSSGQQPTFGQQPANGQQQVPGQQSEDGQADGTAFGFDLQEIPAMFGTEDI